MRVSATVREMALPISLDVPDASPQNLRTLDVLCYKTDNVNGVASKDEHIHPFNALCLEDSNEAMRISAAVPEMALPISLELPDASPQKLNTGDRAPDFLQRTGIRFPCTGSSHRSGRQSERPPPSSLLAQ